MVVETCACELAPHIFRFLEHSRAVTAFECTPRVRPVAPRVCRVRVPACSHPSLIRLGHDSQVYARWFSRQTRGEAAVEVLIASDCLPQHMF